MDNPIIMIPTRLASSRLPNKPLALIGGVPMIVRVYRLAQAAAQLVNSDRPPPIVVAAADKAIIDVIAAEGGTAHLTDPALPSGSDRIYAALHQLDPDCAYDSVVNLQGDLPLFDPAIIPALLDALLTTKPQADITTPVVAITGADAQDPNFVKAVLADDSAPSSRALYFSRQPVPHGSVPDRGDKTDRYFGHIGIYAYRRAALARFVALPAAPIEHRESLEQLRALAAGFHIEAVQVNDMPLSVDTPADLSEAEATLQNN